MDIEIVGLGERNQPILETTLSLPIQRVRTFSFDSKTPDGCACVRGCREKLSNIDSKSIFCAFGFGYVCCSIRCRLFRRPRWTIYVFRVNAHPIGTVPRTMAYVFIIDDLICF